jgi:transcriptional regulator
LYQPALHREDRLDVQHALIAAHPFGLLISTGEQGLLANGLPWLIRPDAAPLGGLHGHMARANPQWQTLEGQQVLVVFQGPQTYITPSYYETKKEHGKVVPTWNYVMVQVRGTARLRDDQAWLEAQIDSLTDKMEAPRPEPWAVKDAPRDFIEMQMRAIVGIEIDITDIQGKWKVSQNRSAPDRLGVAQGLTDASSDEVAMAAIVRAYGNL